MALTEEENYLVLDHVLLSYSGKDSLLSIPKTVNGEMISRIGKGALAESNSLKSLVIPAYIREIGERAVSDCRNLETVHLTGGIPAIGKEAFFGNSELRQIKISVLPVKEEQYRQMVEDSFPTPEGERITERFPQIPVLEPLAEAMGLPRNGFVPKEAGRLFTAPSRGDGAQMVPQEWSCLRKLIGSGQQIPTDRTTEEINDTFVRRGQNQDPYRGLFFAFREKQTAPQNGIRLLEASIRCGCFFWQNIVAISWEGQNYYLYQRNYPYNSYIYQHHNEGFLYLRRNMGIYTQTGPVTDQKLVKEIYAKYLLLSIL